MTRSDDLRERIELRIKDLQVKHDNTLKYSGAQTKATLSMVIALLKDDLGDGICRCVRNNGVGPYADESTGLWCRHDKNELRYPAYGQRSHPGKLTAKDAPLTDDFPRRKL